MTSSVKWSIGGIVGAVIVLLLFLWTAPGRQTGTVELDAGRWSENVNSDVYAWSILANALTKYPNASEFVVSYYSTRYTQAKLAYNRKVQTVSYKTDTGGSEYSNVAEYSIKEMAARGYSINSLDNWGGRLILPTPAPDSGSAPDTGANPDSELN